MNQRLSLYKQHGRYWRDNHYVYPVISRRSKGLSIGVNLNPDTACNFDCVYCCVDRTVAPKVREVDLNVVADELDGMLHLATSGELFAQAPFDQTPAELRRINDVAFSGDGEPTAYLRFDDACRMVAERLSTHGLPEVKIVVITNATLLHRPAVRLAMEFLDAHNGEIWAKLDAGTEAYYRQVERTTIPLARVVENIQQAAQARPLVIQSLFMRIDGVGPTDAEIEAYVQRLRDIGAGGGQIKLVQIYTVARRTAEVTVEPLDADALHRIADLVRATGIAAEAYG